MKKLKVKVFPGISEYQLRSIGYGPQIKPYTIDMLEQINILLSKIKPEDFINIKIDPAILDKNGGSYIVTIVYKE